MVLSAEERQHSVQQRRYSLLQDEDQALQQLGENIKARMSIKIKAEPK